MTSLDLPRPRRILPLALTFGLFALPALAQGTPEQQEACAPDAVKLCPDTIPDVGRTTVCMRRHEAELTPRCRAVFRAATGGEAEPRARRAARDADDNDVAAPRRSRAPAPRERRIVREAPPRDDDAGPDVAPGRYRGADADEETYARGRAAPDDAELGVRQYEYLTPEGEPAQAPEPQARDFGDRQRARDEIGRLCEDGSIGPDTCATTNRALNDGR